MFSLFLKWGKIIFILLSVEIMGLGVLLGLLFGRGSHLLGFLLLLVRGRVFGLILLSVLIRWGGKDGALRLRSYDKMSLFIPLYPHFVYWGGGDFFSPGLLRGAGGGRKNFAFNNYLCVFFGTVKRTGSTGVGPFGCGSSF